MLQEQTTDVAALEGKAVHASDGEELGTVAAVLLDAETRKPEWLAVKRGLLGSQVLVPVAEVRLEGDAISVPYTIAQVDEAPQAEGEEISQETERALASHYGLAYSEERSPTGLAEGRDRRGSSGERRDRPSRRADDGPTRDELYAEARRLGIEGRSKMNKRELARAVERQGGKSGRRAEKANPIEVQKFLEGVDYPTRKADLVREAKRQGADESVRSTLERIRDEKFDSPADVSEAIGRLS